jgi:uncharacterized protein (UPF0335 family)
MRHAILGKFIGNLT